jgi:hypothetical protein
MTKHRRPESQISDQVVSLCTSTESVSSLLAEDPTLAPGDAWKRLYGDRALKAIAGDAQDDHGSESPKPHPATHDELQRAASCGKWGPTKPSELFLRVCTSIRYKGPWFRVLQLTQLADIS